ncbi:MAG TPA: diacylglycerol kinase family protein [Gaiellaceae bacterium]|jgi:diacylglycerol kinase family enzyme|nr:diacylglycerol kinase family protein [Gaiellaceae bacterium]
MEVVLIVNPFASAVSNERVAAVERELGRAATVWTHFTQRPGHGTELAAGSGEADAVVVLSGDGGFNEVLNGAPDGVPLGFLPGGGTSVLPRALGLPRDATAAARRVADALEAGRVRRITVGRVNGRRFGFSSGIGLDAELVRRVDALGRREDGKRPGDLAYLSAAAKLAGSRRARLEPALEVRGHGRAAFALVANTDPYTYAGRFAVHVSPEARFELGLDLVAPERVGPADVPRLLRRAFSGSGLNGAKNLLYLHDLDRIEIACDRPLPLQADGEDLGDIEEAVFEAERDAIAVLI